MTERDDMTDGANDPRPSLGGLAVRRPSRLDEPVLQLLRAKNLCVVNTHGRGGTIHSRPVWVDTDGSHVVVNSVRGRSWVNDLERAPEVTCTVVNLENPYEFVSIEGRVVGSSAEGAAEHIDYLAQKYLGLDRYPFATGSRLKILVLPERILHMLPEDEALG
jgi:PPOX class probable F420-dependent enzyme